MKIDLGDIYEFGCGSVVIARAPKSTRVKPDKRCKACGKLKCIDEFAFDIAGVEWCKDVCKPCEEKRWQLIQQQLKMARRRIPPENVRG